MVNPSDNDFSSNLHFISMEDLNITKSIDFLKLALKSIKNSNITDYDKIKIIKLIEITESNIKVAMQYINK